MAVTAGMDILLKVNVAEAEAPANYVAIAGQRGATLNRSRDTIDTTCKDSAGGWKTSIAGMGEWSIDTDGILIDGDENFAKLEKAFINRETLVVQMVNAKTGAGYEGEVVITDFPLEAPYDDAMTYSLSLAGAGELKAVPKSESDS